MSDRFPAPAPLPSRSPPWYRRLIGITVVLTLVLIMVGAYVRLTDAGLGCPDWPGCYGQLTPMQAKDAIAQAVAEQGGEHGPVSMGKAWREMIHRYIAKILGLLVIGISIIAWRHRHEVGQSPALPIALVGVVILQGIFGMWTVTLLLKPAIVTGHLAGGLITFALLLWLWLRQQPQPRYIDPEPVAALVAPALVGLALLSVQILLGGWTSTNYAALACPDLPTCQGSWWPEMNFADAFHVFRELGMTADGEHLPMQALTAIHMMHRIGALVVLAALGWLGHRVMRTEGQRGLGLAILAVLLLQFGLGLANVAFSLPLALAVAHNGVAALLLALLVVLNFRARRARLFI
ncbi:MAG TPA: COX15/CtaA family protein [Burkholderiaceae bacterium]|nr:COX15/CtaA family protein [Burkholderiaceae bacterium]